jgi:hypothetical protein
MWTTPLEKQRIWIISAIAQSLDEKANVYSGKPTGARLKI